MVNIVDVDIEYFPGDENAHMNVIVVDLSCENTKELLKEVRALHLKEPLVCQKYPIQS